MPHPLSEILLLFHMVRSIARGFREKSAILVTVKTEEVSKAVDPHRPGEGFLGSGWQRKQAEDRVGYGCHLVGFRGLFQAKFLLVYTLTEGGVFIMVFPARMPFR